MVAADDAKDIATVEQAGFVDLGVMKGNAGKSGDAVSVASDQNGSEKTVNSTHLLVAGGRIPKTEEL